MKTTFLKKNKVTYDPGDAIAWTGFGGRIMCGTVTRKWYDTYDVQRVDGGACTVSPNLGIRAASLDEWDECIKSFTKQGWYTGPAKEKA